MHIIVFILLMSKIVLMPSEVTEAGIEGIIDDATDVVPSEVTEAVTAPVTKEVLEVITETIIKVVTEAVTEKASEGGTEKVTKRTIETKTSATGIKNVTVTVVDGATGDVNGTEIVETGSEYVTQIEMEILPEDYDIQAMHRRPYVIYYALKYFNSFLRLYGVESQIESEKDFYDTLEVFTETLRTLNELNKKSRTAVYKINKFSATTFENFTANYTGFDGESLSGDGEKYEVVGDSPESFDWRANLTVSNIKDQGNCGNSYVFSVVGALESQYSITHSYVYPFFSEQQGFECESEGSCEKGGLPHLVADAYLSQGGIMLEKDYPYKFDKEKGTCSMDSSKVLGKVTSVTQLNFDDEDALRDALYHLGPLVTTIYASPSVKNYRAGILDSDDCDNVTNHAVLLVGYGSEHGVPYWMIKNSWGYTWGEGGYLRLIRGKAACNVGMEYVLAVTVQFDPTTLPTPSTVAGNNTINGTICDSSEVNCTMPEINGTQTSSPEINGTEPDATGVEEDVTILPVTPEPDTPSVVTTPQNAATEVVSQIVADEASASPNFRHRISDNINESYSYYEATESPNVRPRATDAAYEYPYYKHTKSPNLRHWTSEVIYKSYYETAKSPNLGQRTTDAIYKSYYEDTESPNPGQRSPDAVYKSYYEATESPNLRHRTTDAIYKSFYAVTETLKRRHRTTDAIYESYYEYTESPNPGQRSTDSVYKSYYEATESPNLRHRTTDAVYKSYYEATESSNLKHRTTDAIYKSYYEATESPNLRQRSTDAVYKSYYEATESPNLRHRTTDAIYKLYERVSA